MDHSDFASGDEFRTATGVWRCTDIGTRTIIGNLAGCWLEEP